MSVTVPEIPDTKSNSVQEDLTDCLKMEQLPAMPHSALMVLQLDSDLTKININDIVHPIEADPGLASQVLKFLNSAFFGFQSRITNIKQGIALAGIRIVKNFVLWKAVFSLIPKSEGGIFDVKKLWQDSLRRALFARIIASKLKVKDPDTVFVGALLQDMAIPLLLKKKTQQYTDLFKILQNHPEYRLSEQERQMFGWTHADAAAMMCQVWKFPEDLTTLISCHTKVEPYLDNPKTEGAKLAVSLSALLPSVINDKWYEQDMLQNDLTKIFPDKKISLIDCFQQVDREFAQYASILHISSPSTPLADQIRKD